MLKIFSEVKYRVKSEILDSSDIDRLLEKICGQLLSVKAVMSTWVGIRYGCGNGFFILVANRSTGVRRLEVKDLGNIICMNSCEERLVKRVMDTSTECQSCFMKDIHEGDLVVTSSQKNSDNGCFTVSISLDRVYENYPEIDNFVNDLCLDILNAMGRYRSQAKIIELKEIAERKQLLMEHRLSLIAFAAGSSIPVFLDEVLERLKKLTNSKAGFCYLVNEHRECALSKWSEGSQWEKLHNLIEGTGLLKCCVDSKKPVIENGYRKKGNNRIYRWLMVPVIRNSHVVSIMGVGSKNDFYNDNDIEVLTYIADVTWEIVLRKNSDADNDRLLAAVQQTGEAITVTDTKGVIEYANPAFTDITGYAESELLGCNMRVLDSSIENRDFYAEMLNKIGEGKRWSGQIVNRKKDGNLYTAYLTVSPVTDELGEVINFVAVMRDISAQLAERKEKELLEAQLFQAQKMEAVGRLAGGVAHDFNNILTAISGFAELAGMNTDQDSIAYSDIQEIDAACRRAAGLTRQLLAFSRKDIVKPENT